MPENPQSTFPRPSWRQAGIWMGCDFFGLTRLLLRNGFRVRWSYLPDCMIDVSFSLANTGLGGVKNLLFARRLNRVELTDDPVFIIGHWRTGTTLLHELLALDPRHRCPTTFECFAPNHFLVSERFLKGWTGFVLPSRRPADNMEMGWDRPQEDEFALCNLGVPSPYATIAFPNHPPQFQEYFELEDVPPRLRSRWRRTFLSFLRQLAYKRPGRIVLKSPPHTFRLPLLCEMFPRARFVHMVRNPYLVFMSTVRLWKSLYASHGYQKPNYQGLEEFVFETFLRMHRRLDATRELVDSGRFHQLRYEDVIRNPVAEMRTLYKKLALGEFAAVEAAIEDYFRRGADYQTNRYELTPKLHAEITRRWKPYIEEYGYSTSREDAGRPGNGI